MPAESPEGTILPTTNIIDSVGHIWTLGAGVAHGYALLRDGIQHAGGQGVLLLYYGHKVYTKNDLGQWYMATDTTWLSVSDDPRPTSVAGLDVSLYQAAIDWTKVKSAGKAFAFIKATQSNDITDPYFYRNWQGARAVGLPRGAYHFYRFATTPQSQAERLLAVLGSDLGELPVVVDLEDTQPSTAPNLDDVKAFVDIVQNATHRKVMLYSAKWYFDRYQLPIAPDWMRAMDLWVASYQTGTPVLPDGMTKYVFWQYTSSGVVDGVNGDVDLNRFNGDQTDFNEYLKTVTLQPPAPPTSAWRGLHMRADGNSTDLDFKCLTVAKLNGAKLMTNTSFEELDRLLTLVPASNIVLRLFAAGDDPILGNAQNFFNVQDAWLSYFNSKGCKWVEVHNEMNLPQEGLGAYWKDANGFAAWYSQVYSLIKAKYPNLQVAMGGLSPQPNVPEWLSMMQANISKCDWVASHSYWVDAPSMDSPESGRYYRKFLSLGKPIIITEFANVQTIDSDAVKGEQYAKYVSSLESGMLGACCFVSSASDKTFNSTRQTFVRNSALTDIPIAMGKY